MKLCKVHLPDCSKAISLVKSYSWIGTWVGWGLVFGGGWALFGLAVVGVFVLMFVYKSVVGMCMALSSVVMTAGRFVKGGIDGLSDAAIGVRRPEIPSSDYDDRDWRRSA